ncbi:MAG TPA: methyltransferase [Gemmataceae bacterium]
METAAYYVALVVLVVIPPTILYWLLIHPFAEFWRRLGPLPTYLIVGTAVVLFGVGIYQFREPLLRERYGVRTPLAIAAAILLILALYLRVQIHRVFSAATLVGVPEVSRREGGGELITAGIYAKVRHPRYVEGGLVLAAAALFSNYLAAYVLLALYVPLIYLVVLLEERELRRRFGGRYDEYARRVPRFIPKMGRHT